MDFSLALLNQSVRLLFALVFLPVALTSLSQQEVNLWFLLMSVIGIGQSLSYGLLITVGRYLSYTRMGVMSSDFMNITGANRIIDDECRNLQQHEIFSASKLMFSIISFIFAIIWILSYFSIFSDFRHQIEESAVTAVFFAGCLSVLALYFQHNQAVLEGTGNIALVQKVGASVYAVGVILLIPIAAIGPDLLMLIAFHQLIVLLSFIGFRIHVVNKFSPSEGLFGGGLSSPVFKTILNRARLSSFTSIVSGLIKQIPFLVLSVVISGVALSNVLLTKRLFEILETFSTAIFSVKNPELSRLYAGGILCSYRAMVLKSSAASLCLFLVGAIIIVFASDVVELISDIEFRPEPPLLALFALGYFLARINSILLSICNHSNNVKEHVAISIYAIVYVCLIFPLYHTFGVYALALIMVVGALINLPLCLQFAIRSTLQRRPTLF